MNIDIEHLKAKECALLTIGINGDDNFKYIRINGADYDVTEVIKYIENKEPIKAVRVLKDAAGISLTEAKNIIDTIIEIIREPQSVPKSQKRGFLRRWFCEH